MVDVLMRDSERIARERTSWERSTFVLLRRKKLGGAKGAARPGQTPDLAAWVKGPTLQSDSGMAPRAFQNECEHATHLASCSPSNTSSRRAMRSGRREWAKMHHLFQARGSPFSVPRCLLHMPTKPQVPHPLRKAVIARVTNSKRPAKGQGRLCSLESLC